MYVYIYCFNYTYICTFKVAECCNPFTGKLKLIAFDPHASFISVAIVQKRALEYLALFRNGIEAADLPDNLKPTATLYEPTDVGVSIKTDDAEFYDLAAADTSDEEYEDEDMDIEDEEDNEGNNDEDEQAETAEAAAISDNDD